MRGKCVTLLATASIQEYIFRSNRLKENAGASHFVRESFDWWETRKISGCERLIFSGGGRSGLLFSDKPRAIAAIQEWSRYWLEHAPGLRFVVAHEDVEESAREAFGKAKRQLDRNEGRPPFGAFTSLPVARDCPSTRLGASEQDDQSEAWLSAEAFAKRRNGAEASDYFNNTYTNSLRGLKFPKDFEFLTTRGASQIAVVHLDGNNMGARFKKIENDPDLDGDAFFDRYWDASQLIKDVSKTTLGRTIEALVTEKRRLEQQGVKSAHLPLRVLVDGGDDTTFVCHGKLGLALATTYLRNFHQASRERGGEWSACAGVAVVPGKFPFARAYKMAEDLTNSAKAAKREADRQVSRKDPSETSWIDFQVVLEGSAGSIEAIRAIQYRSAQKEKLHQRPYNLDAPSDYPNSWDRFQELWEQFQDWPRSRAKGFLEALADDREEEMLRACRAANIELPRYDPSAFWDPLEMLDFHVLFNQPSIRSAHA